MSDPTQLSFGDEPEPEPKRSTYRERRARKAERLREWADKREAKAGEAYERFRRIGDAIPPGQPILVGHHSERGHRAALKRMDSAISQSAEHDAKAKSMRSKADNIEAAAKVAIYSDDPDARERLVEKIAVLEARRDHIKRLNGAARKGTLTDAERLELARANQHAPIPGKHGGFPSYHLTNLSGNLSRLRKRLAAMDNQKGSDHDPQ